MNINPKLKFALGLAMGAGSAIEFYNASKSTGWKKVMHLIAGGGLLVAG